MISTARPGSHPLFMYGVSDAVEAAVRVDRLDEVSAHADRFRHWAEQSRSSVGLALLARCLGLIDATNAGEHFARASSSHRRCRRSTRDEASSYTASGSDGSVGGSTPAAACGAHSSASLDSARGRGKPALARSCAQAVKPLAGVTPQRATS